MLAALASLASVAGPATPGVCEEPRGGGETASSPALQEIVRRLETSIPERLKEAGVPGLSIVLIRDHEIAWSYGFGTRCSWTRAPVTPRTVMQVGSISKVIGAYGALKLVDRGLIALDRPLDEYLGSPWLTDPEGRRGITARRVLTHTSGLSNDVAFDDRDPVYPPGERFSYSGMGFQYLQAVLEAVRGRTLDEIMHEEVFEPLGMSSASFDPVFDRGDDVSDGHVPLSQVNAMVLPPFAAVAALLAAIGLLVNRLRRARWRLGWRGRLLAGAGSASVVAGLLVRVLGAKLTMAMAVAASAFTVSVVGVCWSGWWLIGRVRRSPGPMRAAAVAAWCIAVFGVLWFASSGIPVPVPGVPSRGGGLAWSLHSTAGDLAVFVLELMRLDRDGSGAVGSMMEPQVAVSDVTAWGMGIGLVDGPDGRAFFHTGQNLGFEALMVGLPVSGDGIVILTNGSGGLRVAEDVACDVLGPVARGMADAILAGE